MKAAQSSAAPDLTGGFHHWQAAGLCATDYDPDFFFDISEKDHNAAAAAKSVCAGCTIRERCLDAAMLADEEYGIWGGMTPLEREEYRPMWERMNGGRGAVRTQRKKTGIVIHDPSIQRRYAARLKAAQECRRKILDYGTFHRCEEFLAVLEAIISNPTEDSGKLSRRLGFSKAWFNTMKREAFDLFDVQEVCEEEIA